MVDSDSGDSLALLEAEKLPLRGGNGQMASSPEDKIKLAPKTAIAYRKPSDSDDSDADVNNVTQQQSKSRRNQILPGTKRNFPAQMATVMSQTDICGEDFHHHQMVDNGSQNVAGQMVDAQQQRQLGPKFERSAQSDLNFPPKFEFPTKMVNGGLDDSKVDRASLASSGNLSAADFCRICHCGDPPLISPCFCAGTSRWVHQRSALLNSSLFLLNGN